MLIRTRLPGAAFCWLLFAPSLAPGAQNEVVSIHDGDFFDGFITNAGRAVLAVGPPGDEAEEQPRSTLMSWSGGKAHAQEIDFVVKRLREAPNGRILAWGYRGPRERLEAGSGWPGDENVLGFRVYRATPTAFRLEREFDVDMQRVDAGFMQVSDDLKVWVEMRDLYPPEAEPWHGGGAIGRQFAIGSMKSGKPRRTIDVELFRAAPLMDDVSAFVILDSDGPVVLASYSTHLFLHRFTDDGGVESRPVDHLRFVVHPAGASLRVIWQQEDQVLWARSGDEWLAFDLWNLAYTFDVPREPFLRRKATGGGPHPTRGFVRLEEDGEGRFRVRHRWQSPRFPDWHEEHLSGWRDKKPREASWRSQPIVSSNGRHFLHLESARSDDGVLATTVQRVGLAPASPPRPPEAKAGEGEAASVKRPKSADG